MNIFQILTLILLLTLPALSHATVLEQFKTVLNDYSTKKCSTATYKALSSLLIKKRTLAQAQDLEAWRVLVQDFFTSQYECGSVSGDLGELLGDVYAIASELASEPQGCPSEYTAIAVTDDTNTTYKCEKVLKLPLVFLLKEDGGEKRAVLKRLDDQELESFKRLHHNGKKSPHIANLIGIVPAISIQGVPDSSPNWALLDFIPGRTLRSAIDMETKFTATDFNGLADSVESALAFVLEQTLGLPTDLHWENILTAVDNAGARRFWIIDIQAKEQTLFQALTQAVGRVAGQLTFCQAFSRIHASDPAAQQTKSQVFARMCEKPAQIREES